MAHLLIIDIHQLQVVILQLHYYFPVVLIEFFILLELLFNHFHLDLAFLDVRQQFLLILDVALDLLLVFSQLLLHLLWNFDGLGVGLALFVVTMHEQILAVQLGELFRFQQVSAFLQLLRLSKCSLVLLALRLISISSTPFNYTLASLELFRMYFGQLLDRRLDGVDQRHDIRASVDDLLALLHQILLFEIVYFLWASDLYGHVQVSKCLHDDLPLAEADLGPILIHVVGHAPLLEEHFLLPLLFLLDVGWRIQRQLLQHLC